MLVIKENYSIPIAGGYLFIYKTDNANIYKIKYDSNYHHEYTGTFNSNTNRIKWDKQLPYNKKYIKYIKTNIKNNINKANETYTIS